MHIIRVTTEAEREAAFAVRREVFVVEQAVDPAIEYDEHDAKAAHFLAYRSAADEAPVGTARVVIAGHRAKLGRMAVRAERRRQGVGRALTEAALAYAREQGCAEAYLHAQTHALAFYEAMGFTAEGDIFMEADIPHRAMRRRL